MDTELSGDYKDVFFAGPTLASVAMRHEFFRSVISKGGTIRMLIPDPDATSVAMRGLLEHWHTTTDGLKAELQSSLNSLSAFIQSLPHQNRSRIQFKYLSSTPTLSIVMVDSGTDQGVIQVELLPYKTASPNKPHILLSNSNDKKWYEFFKEKNEQMWKDASAFSIEQFDIKNLRHLKSEVA